MRRQPGFEDFGLDSKVKFTHLLSNTTFYTFDVARFYRKAEFGLFGSATDAGYNGFTQTPPEFILVRGDTLRQGSFTGGGRYLRAGTDLGRGARTTQTFIGKADMTSQVTPIHLVKGGFQAKFETLDFLAYGLTDGDAGTDGFQAGIPDSTSLNYNSFDNVRPVTLSTYVQDKIELESFVVNVGLRFDYFNARARRPSDPSDPNIFNPFKKTNIYRDTNGNGVIDVAEETVANEKTIQERIDGGWYTKVDPKFAFSPRFGVAYPISNAGVIHFSYGYFLQIPTLNRLFDNYDYKIRNTSGNYGPFGNPDLENERTTMYELGIKQGLGDFVVDLTAYYRDVRNWVGVSPTILTELPGVTYTTWANRDYANTKGVTLALNRRFDGRYGFDASYTFQVVEGGQTDGAAQFFLGNRAEAALLPLDWDQRHKVSFSLYTGGKRWGASAFANGGSGFPYTPFFSQASQSGPDAQQPYPVNSRRIPAQFQLDVNAYREFDLGGLRPRLFVQVFNLFDRRNVQGVYGDTGRADFTTQSPDVFDAGFYRNPGFYAEPRRIHAGLEFRF